MRNVCTKLMLSAMLLLVSGQLVAMQTKQDAEPFDKSKMLARQTNMSRKWMTVLRDDETESKEFREAMDKIGDMLVTKAYEFLPMKELMTTTPTGGLTMGYDFNCEFHVVPILRAGLALLPAFQKMGPKGIGFLGYEREEIEGGKTISHNYYCKLPKFEPRDRVMILDPMIATGGTIKEAIKKLISLKVKQKNIIVVGVIGAVPGLKMLKETFPKINIICQEIDDKLDENSFIFTGLGDAGDRYCGTPFDESGLTEK